MRFFQSSWFPFFLGIIIVIIISENIFFSRSSQIVVQSSSHQAYNENVGWQPPDDEEIPSDKEGDLIRYGKELIINTSSYLGPKGIIAHLTNGMNCQNCHIDAGKRFLANPYSSVASTYPKYRDRSGRIESIEWRVNECMERSLNGEKLDSLSMEMRAMVAYLKWIGKDVPKGAGQLVRPRRRV